MCFFPLLIGQQVEQVNFCLGHIHDFFHFGLGNFPCRSQNSRGIYLFCMNQFIELHMRDFVLGLVANTLLLVFKSQLLDLRNLGFGQADLIFEA